MFNQEKYWQEENEKNLKEGDKKNNKFIDYYQKNLKGFLK